MVTGTLMFDVEIEVADDAAAQALSKEITEAVKKLTGVKEAEEVDNKLEETD